MSSSDDDFSEDEDYVPEEEAESDDDEDIDKTNGTQGDNKEENGDLSHQKEKIDKLWESFKNDVSDKGKKDMELNDSHTTNQKKDAEESKDKTTKESLSGSKNDTVVITQVYDFAGEDVKVTKEVKRDSEEARRHFKQQTKSVPSKPGILGRTGISQTLKKRPGGGIGGVLGRLGKKPKLSTLEKSKLDWKQYKEEEGIEEELQAYNKGKEGYLEKVSFLKRTEMRQYEKERDLRLKQSSKR